MCDGRELSPYTAGGIKVAASWPDSGEGILGYLGMPSVILRVLQWARGGAGPQSRQDKDSALPLALETEEEGARDPGARAASQS